MHIVFRWPGGDRDLEVDPREGRATLADLLTALEVRPVPGQVAVGPHVVPTSATIVDAGLYEGAIVSVIGFANPDPGPPPPFVFVTLTGPDAGTAYPLPVGRWKVGRQRESAIALLDLEVSRNHAEIVVAAGRGVPAGGPAPDTMQASIVDLGSENGVLVDGRRLEPGQPEAVDASQVIQLGGQRYVIRRAAADDRPIGLDLRRHAGPAGTVFFNRPPRSVPPVPATLIEIPKQPGEPSVAHFSIAATVGPLILAVVMVAVTQDIRFALFSLLSPLIAIGSYVESRRRSTSDAKREQRRYERDLATFGGEIEAAGLVERHRLRQRRPDPAESVRRAELPSLHLWERRPSDPDFLQLFAGIANLSWQPPLRDGSARLAPAVAAQAGAAQLPAAPMGIDLAEGLVGVIGDRRTALAVARSLLCQAAVHHGPADLTIGVFVDPGHQPEWEWCKWLPHTRSGDGSAWLSADHENSDQQLKKLAQGTGPVLVVLDSDRLIEGQHAPARDLLRASQSASQRPSGGFGGFGGHPGRVVSGIVVAASLDRLPAACVTVIETTLDDRTGEPGKHAVVRRMQNGTEVRDVVPAGVSLTTALRCARAIARFEDPDLHEAGAGLPRSVLLTTLMDLDPDDVSAIGERWRKGRGSAALVAPLGVSESGRFDLDLVRDGPHGLIGGTTGSGKSELLRSLVAALAVQADPDHLTFALIDFKGGATFDACAHLPHTVGVVTDLDEEAGEQQTLRALRRVLLSLEAELHRRESVLRAARVDNIAAYLATRPDEPLPRLLVIVDEFGAMAEKIGDRGAQFLSSLVSIAQRGRTLGVHMILAAQRPTGVVNEKIRSNTNLRIALRVQDDDDSLNVIGQRDAAGISRTLPGRACVRLGPGEVVPIQTALVTSFSQRTAGAAVTVRPFGFGSSGGEQSAAAGDASVTERLVSAAGGSAPVSDLSRLVDSVTAAAAAQNIRRPRPVWAGPLPGELDLASLSGPAGSADQAGAADQRAITALVDDPARQRQYPAGWDLHDGNLLLVGLQGSGTTTALISSALSLAGRMSPADLEIYALDFGRGELNVLESLPHTGAVVGAEDRERQMRLIRHLRAEFSSRRADGGSPSASRRRIVVLIDNFSELKSQFTDQAGLEAMEALLRVYTDGPQAGISFAVATDRWAALPAAWAAPTQRWLFRLGDRFDYVAAGLSRVEAPPDVPGRALTPQGLLLQVARPLPSPRVVAEAIARTWSGAPRFAVPIQALPPEVAFASLGAVAQVDGDSWRIPCGLRESDLGVAELELYEGEHALITGPSRSGKSTSLRTFAESLRSAAAGTSLFIAGMGGRRSPLAECSLLDQYARAGEAAALLAHLHTVPGRAVLLIDDAHEFDDADSAIAGLLKANHPGLHLIAAGNADALPKYSHWTQAIRRSKVGLLLRPNIDNDGDFLGVNLPRRSPVQMRPGRGYLVHNGEFEIAHVALPTPLP